MITKRDGKVENFNPDKIRKAIGKAFDSCSKEDSDCISSIVDTISRLASEGITVEMIQDEIENLLMASQHKDVARNYIKYRQQRNIERSNRDKLDQAILTILKGSSNENSNANVDEKSFSGRVSEAAGMKQKDIALNNGFIRPEVVDAYLENRLYIHDLTKVPVGEHNCSFVRLGHLLSTGFTTKNGSVRAANCFSTACQLTAVIFQIQSQNQFGGVGSSHIDFDLAPYVTKSFRKHFREKYYDEYEDRCAPLELQGKEYLPFDIDTVTSIADNRLKDEYPKVYRLAMRALEREGKQAAQGLFHNLNTLESRAGSQVPFSSINFGRDMSAEGLLVNRWLLEASLAGIGKFNQTSIFPISIFQYKKGVNDKPGTPGYGIKQLALESTSKRIYPNYVNCDFSKAGEDPNDIDTYMSTMGCRTMLGYDIFTGKHTRTGRGNVAPATINLARIGINHGICLGTREEADIEGFWKELDELLELTVLSLVDRFNHICSQSVDAAKFMYYNGTMIGNEESLLKDSIYESMKHNTLGIGYIGVAEMCQALFGQDHADSKLVHAFALAVVKRFSDKAQESIEKYTLNFSPYATPAESLCKTFMKGLQKEFGKIPNVTSRDYLTNSHHVPVWKHVNVKTKIDIEAPFCVYPTGGCITYVELESHIMNNIKAIEDIIDYAMDSNIPYLALNFPIDTCQDCGYRGEIEGEVCPKCNSDNLQKLRRVTGYLTTDYRNFNSGKIAEVQDRVKHTKFKYGALE